MADAASAKSAANRLEKKDWVEDRYAVRCTACNIKFTLFVRRHHCRGCGHIYCTHCVFETLGERFGFEGKKVLICAKCLAWQSVETEEPDETDGLTPAPVVQRSALTRAHSLRALNQQKGTSQPGGGNPPPNSLLGASVVSSIPIRSKVSMSQHDPSWGELQVTSVDIESASDDEEHLDSPKSGFLSSGGMGSGSVPQSPMASAASFRYKPSAKRAAERQKGWRLVDQDVEDDEYFTLSDRELCIVRPPSTPFQTWCHAVSLRAQQQIREQRRRTATHPVLHTEDPIVLPDAKLEFKLAPLSSADVILGLATYFRTATDTFGTAKSPAEAKLEMLELHCSKHLKQFVEALIVDYAALYSTHRRRKKAARAKRLERAHEHRNNNHDIFQGQEHLKDAEDGEGAESDSTTSWSSSGSSAASDEELEEEPQSPLDLGRTVGLLPSMIEVMDPNDPQAILQTYNWAELICEITWSVISTTIVEMNQRITSHVNIWCIPGGPVGSHEIVPGVIFRRNIMHADMKTHIFEPQVLLLGGDAGLERSRYQGRITDDIAEYVQSYPGVLDKLYDRIKWFAPNVVIVERSCHHYLAKKLHEDGITLFTHVDRQSMQQIAAGCGTKVYDGLGMMPVAELRDTSRNNVGFCDEFQVRSIGGHHFAVFSGFHYRTYATVILRGADEQILREVQSCLERSLICGHHLTLQAHLLMDFDAILAQIPESPFASDRGRQRRGSVSSQSLQATTDSQLQLEKTKKTIQAVVERSFNVGVFRSVRELTLRSMDVWEPNTIQVNTFPLEKLQALKAFRPGAGIDDSFPNDPLSANFTAAAVYESSPLQGSPYLQSPHEPGHHTLMSKKGAAVAPSLPSAVGSMQVGGFSTWRKRIEYQYYEDNDSSLWDFLRERAQEGNNLRALVHGEWKLTVSTVVEPLRRPLPLQERHPKCASRCRECVAGQDIGFEWFAQTGQVTQTAAVGSFTSVEVVRWEPASHHTFQISFGAFLEMMFYSSEGCIGACGHEFNQMQRAFCFYLDERTKAIVVFQTDPLATFDVKGPSVNYVVDGISAEQSAIDNEKEITIKVLSKIIKTAPGLVDRATPLIRSVNETANLNTLAELRLEARSLLLRAAEETASNRSVHQEIKELRASNSGYVSELNRFLNFDDPSSIMWCALVASNKTHTPKTAGPGASPSQPHSSRSPNTRHSRTFSGWAESDDRKGLAQFPTAPGLQGTLLGIASPLEAGLDSSLVFGPSRQSTLYTKQSLDAIARQSSIDVPPQATSVLRRPHADEESATELIETSSQAKVTPVDAPLSSGAMSASQELDPFPIAPPQRDSTQPYVPNPAAATPPPSESTLPLPPKSSSSSAQHGNSNQAFSASAEGVGGRCGPGEEPSTDEESPRELNSTMVGDFSLDSPVDLAPSHNRTTSQGLNPGAQPAGQQEQDAAAPVNNGVMEMLDIWEAPEERRTEFRSEADAIQFLKNEEPSRRFAVQQWNRDFDVGDNNRKTITVKIVFPDHFAAVRYLYTKGRPDHFLASLQCSQPFSPRAGKSAAKFFTTKDGRFLIKEMKPSELIHFVSIFAPSYFQHLVRVFDLSDASPLMRRATERGLAASLLCKVFGVYEISVKTGRRLQQRETRSYIVMENLFCNEKITRMYDLKGSQRNRTAGDEEFVQLDENFVRQANIGNLFYCRERVKAWLNNAMSEDTSVLSKGKIMDYSLIVGINESSQRLTVGIIDYFRPYTLAEVGENYFKRAADRVQFLLREQSERKEPTVTEPPIYRNRFLTWIRTYFCSVPCCEEDWSSKAKEDNKMPPVLPVAQPRRESKKVNQGALSPVPPAQPPWSNQYF
jgi:hypothetical protein